MQQADIRQRRDCGEAAARLVNRICSVFSRLVVYISKENKLYSNPYSSRELWCSLEYYRDCELAGAAGDPPGGLPRQQQPAVRTPGQRGRGLPDLPAERCSAVECGGTDLPPGPGRDRPGGQTQEMNEFRIQPALHLDTVV